VLDRTDEAILRIVEQDGRISFAELGERISLSRTPCWTRVQNLERQHFISAYRAELNPRLLGLDTHAFVQVRIVAQQQRAFEAAVAKNGSVLECYGITGEADYILHLLVAGTGTLDEVLRNEIASMPGVKGTLTSLALRTIKSRGLIMDCRRDSPTRDP